MASVGPGSGGRGRAEDVAVRSQPGGCRWLRPPRAGEARLAAWRRRDGGCCCWSQRGWGEEKRKKCGAVGPTSASCGGLRTAERPELLERKGGEKETGASELLEASWQPPKARAARWICDLAESPGCCTELVGSRSCGGGASTSQSCGRRTGRTRCPGAASGRAEVTCGGNEQEPRGAGAAVGRAVPGEAGDGRRVQVLWPAFLPVSPSPCREGNPARLIQLAAREIPYLGPWTGEECLRVGGCYKIFHVEAGEEANSLPVEFCSVESSV
ncbi:uncharacterized protein [Patagioenas fasciata]|uniref:uncharacterized protein isoform X3 n=1 Tax=Patagioenas fasciata TaxID=372321 RepID=UPI003A99EC4D